jgi:hypothetical protein
MSKEKLICWRGQDGDIKPVMCICDDEFGYPNYCQDETGKEEKMYENTHFLDKNDAWKSIIKSVKAGIRLSGRRVSQAMDELKKAQAESAEAVFEYHQVVNNVENPFFDDM